MATKTNYNDFGAMMVENRPMAKIMLDSEEMTRNEWKRYLGICDNIAKGAYAYMAKNTEESFSDFRGAIHALYEFIGYDTRILAIDGYSVRFIPAVIPVKITKSKEYKDAEKVVRKFKRALSWACDISNVSQESKGARLFPLASNVQELESNYYNSDTQDYYNAMVALFKSTVEAGQTFTVSVALSRLEALQASLDEIGAQPWQCYKDFQDPMKSSTGKEAKHIRPELRKNIEDAMADILTQRALMSEAQLDKEEAQIKGGRKLSK